ncbi:MAG: hypothetical protein HYX59_09155 [Elusimicrobia bacterium]|nr:hypothetical protein [Elusimicrobiota bacterium]
MKRSTVAAAILFVSAIPALGRTATSSALDRIKTGRMADTESIETWRILGASGITSPEVLRARARENLVKSDLLPFQFHRVEVAGVGSTDDTGATLPDMIDMQAKTSHFDETFPGQQRIVDFGSIQKRATDALNSLYTFFGKDLRESFSDTRGNPSERSKTILAQFKNVRVNELFAHSWGTEVVYLGIMNGSIIPPKKLVIMGVPESNEEKWRMLAAYTGIEVHVIGFEWDKARMVGNLALKFKSGLPEDTVSLRKLWDEKCATRAMTHIECADPDRFVQKKFDYNIHVTPPRGPKETFIKETIRGILDHDRLLYYTYLSNRNLFNKTVAQLEAPQLPLIKAEENRILAEALAEARAMLAEANAAAKAVADAEASERERQETERQRELMREALEKISNSPALVPASPTQQPTDAGGQKTIVFAIMLPNVKDFAVASCRNPGQIRLTEDITRPYESILFLPSDYQVVDRLEAGLGECERRLFRKLVEVMRQGGGRNVTRLWVEEAVRYYTPAPPRQDQTYASPPTEPEKPREPGCSPENGVWGCPK